MRDDSVRWTEGLIATIVGAQRGRMRKDGRRGAREGGFVQRRLSSCNINELKRMQTGRVWERLRRQVIQLGFLWTLEVSPFSLKCVDFSVLPPPSSFLPPLPGWRWHHWAQGNVIKAPRPHQSRPFLQLSLRERPVWWPEIGEPGKLRAKNSAVCQLVRVRHRIVPSKAL